jgi:hypothetical protein
MLSQISRFLIVFFFLINSIFAGNSTCHPLVNKNLPQYVIGYGSLMQEASKREDDKTAGQNYPIYLRGYERGWIEKGRPIGFSTTYLGVRKNASAQINAVYFKASNAKAVARYDKREEGYCRAHVPLHAIRFLTKNPPRKGQFWIYVSERNSSSVTSSYPIAQSYVDIFLSGCFELEKKYKLKHFAKNCVKTTGRWSKYWVNDRLYPRTAADNHPYIYDIDVLIKNELPYYFKSIRIE